MEGIKPKSNSIHLADYSKMLSAFYFALALPLAVLSRDAIQFFIKHRKIEHMSIEILKNADNSSKNWIEYKYIFENDINHNQVASVISSTLKIGVLANNSNKFDCNLINMGHNETIVKGYSIDLIENVKEALNIRTQLQVIHNLEQLQNNTVDLVICHPHTKNVPRNVIELYSTLTSHFVLVYMPTRLKFTKDIFILTFAGSLWLVFFAILILLAVCLRMSTTQYAKFNKKYEAWTWVEITLWAIAAACQQGLSHTPSGFVSCCIFFLGYLMAYLLYTGFAAAITSILVQHDEERNADFNSIRPGKLHLISPEWARFETQHLENKFLRTEYVNNLDELFENLNNDYRIGIGPEVLIKQYMAHNYNFEQISTFRTLKLKIRKYKKGFLVLSNSAWKNILNKQISKMDEYGILQNTLARNLKPIQMFDLNSGYSSAGQEHVGSAILLFLGGVALSILFFVSEFVFYFYKQGRNRLGL